MRLILRAASYLITVSRPASAKGDKYVQPIRFRPYRGLRRSDTRRSISGRQRGWIGKSLRGRWRRSAFFSPFGYRLYQKSHHRHGDHFHNYFGHAHHPLFAPQPSLSLGESPGSGRLTVPRRSLGFTQDNSDVVCGSVVFEKNGRAATDRFAVDFHRRDPLADMIRV